MVELGNVCSHNPNCTDLFALDHWASFSFFWRSLLFRGGLACECASRMSGDAVEVTWPWLQVNVVSKLPGLWVLFETCDGKNVKWWAEVRTNFSRRASARLAMARNYLVRSDLNEPSPKHDLLTLQLMLMRSAWSNCQSKTTSDKPRSHFCGVNNPPTDTVGRIEC